MADKTLLQQYTNAMIAGLDRTCERIERENDLWGYSPELVCTGLAAIDEGKDPHAVIEKQYGI